LKDGKKKSSASSNNRRGKNIRTATSAIVHKAPIQRRNIFTSSSSEININPYRKERRDRRSKGEEKNSSSRKNIMLSKKLHDAPLQKKDIYFALDCEMVGVGPDGLNSALARLTIINWDNELVLDTYVKVRDEVTDYRTFISGIKQEHIESDSAMTLEEAQYVASNILTGKILIGHGLENDLKAIGIGHPWCDIRDTAAYEPYMQSVKKGEALVLRPRKLRDLAWEKLGKKIQLIGIAHSPIEDAIAAMDLYKNLRINWETSNTADYLNKIKRPTTMSRFRKVAIEPTSEKYYPIVSTMDR